MDHARANEAALVGAMRRGDEDAFAQLYAAYRGPLFRYAQHMCGAAAADDVVQETFLALLRGARFDPQRGALAPYLFGIARHHIVKRISAAALDAPAGDEDLVATAAPDEQSPFVDLTRAEAVSAVREAIEALPPAYREVVTLCELEELDYATAAAIVGCPLGTVRSRLHRAKRLLGARLTNAGLPPSRVALRRPGKPCATS